VSISDQGVAADHSDSIRDAVATELAGFLATRAPRLEQMGDELRTMLDALPGYTTGGKLLRPLFCYWGWRGAGGDPGDRGIIRAAAALELLHASALVHDDVMDGSDRRRGVPTAHRRFAAVHREHGWRGSPERFGIGGAILLGDLCLAWSDEALRASGLPTTAVVRALAVFDEMRTEVIAGQYLDLSAQAAGTRSVDEALRVVRYKSAKYTIERPLHLGGALAGGDARLAETYTAYGVPLGEAFQLRDDVLGVFGDPAVTGKPAGDDIREGKRTVLIASAYEAATPAQAAALDHHLGDPDLDGTGVATLREVIVESGALARVEQLIADRTAVARTALGGLDESTRVALEELAAAVTQRDI